MEINIKWFKSTVEPLLKGYEIEYKHFDNGDFGSLSQVEFNSSRIGGNIDFWGLGWFGIFVWNYESASEMLNVLTNPDELKEKEKAIEDLFKILEI